MKRKLTLTIALFSFIFLINECYSSQQKLEITSLANNKLNITDYKSSNIYIFNISINGYEVNCSGEKMVLWGYPVKFVDGSPADNEFVIFDLKTKKTIATNLVSHGIFGAIFLSDNVNAFLDTGGGYIVNTQTGEAKDIDKKMLGKLDSISEKCQKPKRWSYNKFPQ